MLAKAVCQWIDSVADTLHSRASPLPHLDLHLPGDRKQCWQKQRPSPPIDEWCCLQLTPNHRLADGQEIPARDMVQGAQLIMAVEVPVPFAEHALVGIRRDHFTEE